jgi:hypothetical protein
MPAIPAELPLDVNDQFENGTGARRRFPES